MNKIASLSISKSDVIVDKDQFDQEYQSIKLISQEIIEEKEAIIQQIYKQLKDSIRTIDVLTGQLETYKQNQPREIYLTELQQNGFLHKENDHYFIIVDVSKAIQFKRQCIKIDMDLQIINETLSDKIQNKFKVLQSGYSRAMQQCDLFLKALSQKQEKEEILRKKIQTLEISQAELQEYSVKLKEELQILKIQYDQHKYQQINQKNQLIKQRQQLCLELSEIKILLNKQNQKTVLLEKQNKELKQKISQFEERIKSYQLQKIERQYYQQDLIKSYKQSIKFIDYELQYPERQESVFDKENKINLANTQTKNIKSSENQEVLNLTKIDSILIDQRGHKIVKKPFQAITPIQSKSSSPQKQQFIDQFDVNNQHQDTFPEANTVEKQEQIEQKEIKINLNTKKQTKLKGKKQRKVIRINY